MSLTISQELLEKIFSHCREEYPYECCGILIGKANEPWNQKETREIIQAENIRKDRRADRYLMNPDHLFQAYQKADDLNLEVIGFYHSHPDHPNRPSEFDRDRALEIHSYGLSYIVVSVKKGIDTEAKSWILKKEQFEEETIILSETTAKQ